VNHNALEGANLSQRVGMGTEMRDVFLSIFPNLNPIDFRKLLEEIRYLFQLAFQCAIAADEDKVLATPILFSQAVSVILGTKIEGLQDVHYFMVKSPMSAGHHDGMGVFPLLASQESLDDFVIEEVGTLVLEFSVMGDEGRQE
jgi:hypothetical protein